MEGWFGPNWLASLCGELARRGISIERAGASRGADGTWTAELELVALPRSEDPLELSYVELTDSDTQQSVHPLQVLRYSLAESGDPSGTLVVSIEATDAVGLVGNFLGQLAMLLLFPVELHVETRGDLAFDSFVVGAMGERTSARARESLERMLRRACEGSTPQL
jgi:UTP:GlnB (protein PII) uridylyltransferase